MNDNNKFYLHFVYNDIYEIVWPLCNIVSFIANKRRMEAAVQVYNNKPPKQMEKKIIECANTCKTFLVVVCLELRQCAVHSGPLKASLFHNAEH